MPHGLAPWSSRLRLLAAVSALATGLIGLAVVAQPAMASNPVNNPIVEGLPRFYLGSTRFPLTGTSMRSQNSSAVGGVTSAESELVRTKQVLVLPKGLVAANLASSQYLDGTGRFSIPTRVYLQSPDGSPDLFGQLPSITQTTLAFGFVPVSVTAVIRELRDANDRPVPLDVQVDSVYGIDSVLYDVEFNGRVMVSLSDLRVDGQHVDVGSSCQTAQPAEITMVGKNPSTFTRTPEFYYPPYGGDLYGTIDVPAFSGCVTPSGDDLSPLITNAVSAPGNPLHVNQGKPGQNGPTQGVGCPIPLGPGEQVDSRCTAPDPSPIITGLGQVRTTPPNWTPNPSPFPDVNLVPCGTPQQTPGCRQP